MMDVHNPQPPAASNPNLLRDRLANERTYLAWLRTAIALSSLGFVVARFDLFLVELARFSGDPRAGSQTVVPIGVLLILSGPLAVIVAAARFLQTERALLVGEVQSRRLVRTAIIASTTGAIAIGALLSIHLLTSLPN